MNCNVTLISGGDAISNKKDWVNTDYDFEMVYNASLNVPFEYEGKKYYISCEEDSSIYEADEYFRPIYSKPICSFKSREEFYGLTLFGMSIYDVIANSYVGCLS